MDPFSAFFSAQFLFFALAIAAITFTARTIVEYAWKNAPTSNAWNNLILPLLPVVLGAIGGIVSKIYPDPLGASIFAREVFGLTAGLCSGLVYKMLKGYIKVKIAGDSASTTTAVATSTTLTTPTSSTTTNTSQTTQVSGMSSDVYPKN